VHAGVFYLELFRALEADRVRYLVAGGLAVNLHGVARLTMDVDLVIALDAENLGRFVSAASRLSLRPVVPVQLTDLADEAKVRNWIVDKRMLAFALRPPAPSDPVVDLLVQTPMPFEAAYARRVEKTVAGVAVSIASIEDLVAMKTGTGRAKDASDIAALRALQAQEGSGG
jgi:hypothetical protein